MGVARMATAGRGRGTVIRTINVQKASDVGLTTVPGVGGYSVTIAALLMKTILKVIRDRTHIALCNQVR